MIGSQKLNILFTKQGIVASLVMHLDSSCHVKQEWKGVVLLYPTVHIYTHPSLEKLVTQSALYITDSTQWILIKFGIVGVQ
jgi:hypothetical protein